MFVDPFWQETSPSIEMIFSDAMDRSSVQSSIFLREEYHCDGSIIPEINASLDDYLSWFGPNGMVSQSKFLITWLSNDTILRISFLGSLNSPTGNMLRPGGKYTLTIVDNQARAACGGPLELPEGQTEYTFYVPGYGNVDLSSQEVPIYVTPSDYIYLHWHVGDIFDVDLEQYFNDNSLSSELFEEIADVDDDGTLTPADAIWIKFHISFPDVYLFPNQHSPGAPSLQEPAAANDIVVSLGNLTDSNDCSSVIKPAVIAIGQGETEVNIPINICNLPVEGIHSAMFRIQVGDTNVAHAKPNPNFDPNNPQADPREIMIEKGNIVPDNWSLTAGVDNDDPSIYTIMLSIDVDNPITLDQDGQIAIITFEAVSTDPDPLDRTPVTFEEDPILQTINVPPPPTTHPVQVVGNEIALPVTLSALGAMLHPDGGIRIFWEAESQRENLGWNIYRSENKGGKFVKINGDLIKGAGTTANPMKYDFVDKDAISGKSHFYYLENISFDGEKYRSHIIEAILVNQLSSWGAIKNSSLRQTPLASHGTQKPIVLVKIYDAKGNLINNLKKKK
jgi:hypothetical protein